jgi:hypothetical protein
VDYFCSFFSLSVFHKSYFCICFAVGIEQRFVRKLDISKWCSWMHFISPQLMHYKLWRLERWTSKYILLNARLLEVMKININRKSDRRPLDELSSCPMISSECKVLIDFWPCLLIFSNHTQKLKLVKWKCMNGFIISLSLPLFGLFNFIDYRWFDTLQISNVVSLVVLRFAIKHPFWIASFHSVIIGWFFKISCECLFWCILVASGFALTFCFFF